MGRKRRSEDTIANGGAPTARSSGDAAQDGAGQPSAERVRQRALEIYERRRALGLPGDSVGDWLQAEEELGSEPAKS